MNKKIFYIIVIILIIVLIAAIAYLFYTKKLSLSGLQSQKISNLIKNNDKQEEAAKINFNETAEPIEKRIERATPEEMTKDDAAKTATSFAERFGTYSNQANYRNITEAKVFMTTQMQDWADNYLVQLRAASSSADAYYGITTRAVTKEIKDFDPDGGSATILVKTRRQEANGSMDNIGQTFNQDITIKLIKSANTWLVDSAVWGK